MTMVISRTPYRISFFGGGSDYPSWYREEGGAVLSATIDKYCFISCRVLPPFFNVRFRIVWSHIELVNSIAEILHPAVREGLQGLGFDDSLGLEIVHQGDLPARAGMGSSSSFAVGLLRALLALRNESIQASSLARLAIELEQDWLKDSVGSQDQVAAAHGGLNVIRFNPDDTIDVAPLNLDTALTGRLADHLMLMFTGTSRISSEIARTIVTSLPDRKAEIRRMRAMVDPAAGLLRGGDLTAFGEMLHETWMLKRTISDRVCTPQIDEIYETGRRAGVIGGKLLGAGGTGFMLFFVPPERQEDVRRALRHYVFVPFRFEDTGCRIIYQSSD